MSITRRFKHVCPKKAEEDVWERVRIDNDLYAIRISSYDNIRLVISDIGESFRFHPLISCNPVLRLLKGCLGLDPKEEYIAQYGIEAYNKWQMQSCNGELNNPKKDKSYSKEYRKGGKYYEQKLAYRHTGIQKLRNRVRARHARIWAKYKCFVAPDSELYRLWVPESDKCKCVVSVKKGKRSSEFKDVFVVLSNSVVIKDLNAGIRANLL